MEDLESEKLDKKINICRKFGAEKFQKIVYKLENIKFKILKKCFPKFLTKYDKYIDLKTKKALQKTTDEKMKQRILNNARINKMETHKEWYREQNRNYHMDMKYPTRVVNYLKWNKSVHKKGLIKNAIFLPILTVAMLSGFEIAILFLIFEIASTIINFECINLQNYNLCRYKKQEEKLKRMEQKVTKRNIDRYGKASEVIYESMQETEEKLPTFDEIISNITTKEQAIQMKKILQAEQETRNTILKEKRKGEI